MNLSIPVNMAGRKENGIFLPKGMTYLEALGSVDDNFKGNNGDSPNSKLWTSYISNGFVTNDNREILNNTYVATANSVDDSAGSLNTLQALYGLEGDFDIEVEAEILAGTASNRYCGLNSSIGMDVNTFIYGGVYKVGSTCGNAGWTELNVGSGISKLRLTRVGSIGTAYYTVGIPGSGWIQLVSGTVGTGLGRPLLVSQTHAALGTFSSKFDNFKVNSGRVVNL